MNYETENPIILIFNGLDGIIGQESGVATTRFSPPVRGSVEKVVRVGGECAGKVFAVRINFEAQPQNNGEVTIQGSEIFPGSIFRNTLDFSLVPEGIETIINGSKRFHGVDPLTGSYIYEVTNLLENPDSDPCDTPSLGSWVEGDNVKAISPIL